MFNVGDIVTSKHGPAKAKVIAVKARSIKVNWLDSAIDDDQALAENSYWNARDFTLVEVSE